MATSDLHGNTISMHFYLVTCEGKAEWSDLRIFLAAWPTACSSARIRRPIVG